MTSTVVPQQQPTGDRDPDAGLHGRSIALALAKVRVLAAALVLVQLFVGSDRTGPLESVPDVAMALAVVLVVAAVNLWVQRTASSQPRRGTSVQAPVEIITDAALALMFATMSSGLDAGVNWALLVFPVLEAALRYRMLGALVTWSFVGLVYVAVRANADGWSQAEPAVLVEQVQLVLYRLGVVLLVAVPGGHLSQQLVVEISAQRRARARAARRGELLAVVARAGERLNALGTGALDEVEAAALELGFEWAQTWTDADPRGSAATDDPELVMDARLVDLSRHVLRVGEPVVLLAGHASAPEQALLRHHDLAALIAAPLSSPDVAGSERQVVLAGVGVGQMLEPAQLEALTLVTAQARIALQNERLIEELQEAQDTLRHRAFHDALTGLANRAQFQLAIDHVGQRRVDALDGVGVLFLDLDGFKGVNDTHGHDVGDELLRSVASRLTACVRSTDLVCRLGGDEFTVLLRGNAVEERAVTCAQRICEALAEPFALSSAGVRISTSVGIATATGDDVDANRLVRRADAAMYRAKTAGKGRWVLDGAEVAGHGGVGVPAPRQPGLRGDGAGEPGR